MLHKKLPHLIYFALATFFLRPLIISMFLCRRRFYSDLRRLKKNGGQWIFGGASNFSNLLAPWASGSRSLMLRAGTGARTVSPSCRNRSTKDVRSCEAPVSSSSLIGCCFNIDVTNWLEVEQVPIQLTRFPTAFYVSAVK